MKIKGTPDLDEALFLFLKYVLRRIIPGEHWVPKNLRQAIQRGAVIIAFLVGLLLAYAKFTARL